MKESPHIDPVTESAANAPKPATHSPGVTGDRSRIVLRIGRPILAALITIDAALLAWVLLLGGGGFTLLGLDVSVKNAANPSVFMLALLAIWTALNFRRIGRVGQLVRAAWNHFKVSSIHGRIALLLSMWVIIHNAVWLFDLQTWLEPPKRIPPEHRSVILANGYNLHALSLLDAIANETHPGPFVIRIHDVDMRGHTAAFYAYPRLLRMEPSERAWGLRDGMRHAGPTPSKVRAGQRPSMTASRAFARASDQSLLIASPKKTRVTWPEANRSAMREQD